MAGRIVECGRAEIRGATVRFKQKGTLEAFDRNFADLAKLYVRLSPQPQARLFADFVFPGEIFRVFQDSTLVNYKDFLAKVEFSGVDNFRALVRHSTAALPVTSQDTATREFAEKNAQPERFVSREEIGEYERAVTEGTRPPEKAAGDAAASTPSAMSDEEKRRAAERAWSQFAGEIAQTRAERASPTAAGGLALSALGGLIVLGSLAAFIKARAEEGDGTLPAHGLSLASVVPIVALAAVVGLALFVVGLLYLKPRDRS